MYKSLIAKLKTYHLAGELINALAGPVALLLNMTGHHNDTTKVLSFTVITNIILNAILIPSLGAEGAAIACTYPSSVTLRELILK